MFASAVRPTGVFFSGHLSQGTPVFEAEPPRRERAEERTCPEADDEQLRKMIKQAEYAASLFSCFFALRWNMPPFCTPTRGRRIRPQDAARDADEYICVICLAEM